MSRKFMLAIALASTTAMGASAYAASAASTASDTAAQTQMTSQDKAAMKDFTKLSEDGFKAFRNARLARLAIFNGEADQAKKLVSDANSAMKTASSDDAVFEKAMADITPPKGASANKAASSDKTTQNSAKTDSKTASDTTPVQWLPIDGQVSIAEAYDATPEKSDAVAKANQSLKKGDRQEALDTLKLAGIDVEYATVLVPLKTAQDQLAAASKDMDAGKYYEANLDLKKIEDGIVVDVVDVFGTPKSGDQHSSKSQTSSKSAQQSAMNKSGSQNSDHAKASSSSSRAN